MNSVGLLASGIWDDLNQPETPSINYISGWIGTDRAIGKLNLLINTDFIIDNQGVYENTEFDAGGYSGVYQKGDFYPALGNTEAAILAEIYKYSYYDLKIRDVLNGIFASGSAVDWNELTEGDTTIRRSNRNEVAKTYRGLQSDSKDDLKRLVDYYRSNISGPSQITLDVSNNCNIFYSWSKDRIIQ